VLEQAPSISAAVAAIQVIEVRVFMFLYRLSKPRATACFVYALVRHMPPASTTIHDV